MSENFEDLIKRSLEGSRILNKPSGECLSEEDFACFVEEKLDPGIEAKREHLLSCTTCRNALKDCMLILKDVSEGKGVAVPAPVSERAKALVSEEVGPNILDVVIAVGKTALELVRATGDVIVAGTMVPVPVLRSGGRTQGSSLVREEVRVVKSLSNIVAAVQVEKRRAPDVDMTLRLTEANTKKRAKGIRVTLIKGQRELESLIAEEGKATFQELRTGRYRLLLSKNDEKLGIVTVTLTER